MRNAFKKGDVNLITKISWELDFSMTLEHFSQRRPDALHALTTPDGAVLEIGPCCGCRMTTQVKMPCTPQQGLESRAYTALINNKSKALNLGSQPLTCYTLHGVVSNNYTGHFPLKKTD